MLLLDSEAISAPAHGPPDRRDRVRALIQQMRKHQLPVAVVAAVLCEVVRGRSADAAAFSVFQRERVEVRPVDGRVGIRASRLLGRVQSGSALAVDAFVVAVADLAGGAVIATGDPDDMKRLATYANKTRVVDVS
ncbi:MAG: PIN domain-containing protein [Deltaproteobacteria bacterium]|nr:PIN domain-containing protein [Deltaproteobacteria bacterium]